MSCQSIAHVRVMCFMASNGMNPGFDVRPKPLILAVVIVAEIRGGGLVMQACRSKKHRLSKNGTKTFRAFFLFKDDKIRIPGKWKKQGCPQHPGVMSLAKCRRFILFFSRKTRSFRAGFYGFFFLDL